MEYRIEHDTMGEVRVPADALYGAQTQRATENFPVSGQRLGRDLIAALGQVKRAAAQANADLGVLDAEVAAAVVAAAEQVIAGEWDAHFPIDVYQTGSGTSSNMNTNEVIAHLASRALGRPVHPNDHVNASQSSNDVFPTTLHVAAYSAVADTLLPGLETLRDSLLVKAEEFDVVVKSGRTHLMDATPVTLGQEFGGYAAMVGNGIERVRSVLPRLARLALGGTAVGTGINTPDGFAAAAIGHLAEHTGHPFTETTNHFEAQATIDGLVDLAGALTGLAVSLTKICNDLRWMGSGPRTGLGEIAIPDLQPGSSIMPGKVNPVIAEATLQVCARVIGNGTTLTVAGSSGAFELNVMLPVSGQATLESVTLLGRVSGLLATRCVDGITAHADRCLELARSSPSVVTPLNRYIGYENAAKIAKHAVAEGLTIRDAAVQLGFVERGEISEADLDAALDVTTMTGRH